jgi:hypothetical protein
MRTRGLLVFSVLIACASALPAQATMRLGRVRGLVLDSLLGGPLADATVVLTPVGRRTLTDSTGRFAFDSVPPGEWTVVFHHPALDSLGISDHGTPVRVFAGATASATLATTSFENFRTPFCGETADSLSSTVAFGGVHLAYGTHVKLDVSVTWMDERRADGAPRAGSVRTQLTDDGEVWVACGIPWGAWLRASVRDSLRTGSAILAVGPRGIAVHHLVLAAGTAPISGTVRTPDGDVVPGARVSIVGTDLAAETDARGAFVVPNAPASTFTLDVRAAGWRPWLGALEGGGNPFDVQLGPMRATWGRSPTGSDYLRLLERRDRDGILLIAGPELQTDDTPLSSVIPQATCRWWVDGRPVERDFFLAQPRWSWRAIEAYPHGADAPPEYRASSCSVALLWTVAADW